MRDGFDPMLAMLELRDSLRGYASEEELEQAADVLSWIAYAREEISALKGELRGRDRAAAEAKAVKTESQKRADRRARAAAAKADKTPDSEADKGGGQGADKGRTVSGQAPLSDSPLSLFSAEISSESERENAREGRTVSADKGGQGADKTPDSEADKTVVRVAPSRRKSDKKPALIPADWTPTAEHRAFAAKHGLDLEREVFSFRGYFDGQAVLSPNGRFATWLNNAAERRLQRSGGSYHVAPAATPKSHRLLT